MKGSWAGAMGQPQFMPSSYLKYAVDFDGDGRRDIWGSQPDVFASIANYLKAQRVADGRAMGAGGPGCRRRPRRRLPRPRRCAARGCAADAGDDRAAAAVAVAGARRAAERRAALPKSEAAGVAACAPGSRGFLVYRNYEALLGYNCAHAYALSVALLSDRMAAEVARHLVNDHLRN